MTTPARVLLLCGIALLAACSAASPKAAQAPQAAPSASTLSTELAAYRLGIGDRVRVDVFGEPDLTTEAVVDGTGQISYPLLGSVVAIRKTALELAASIRAGLANGYLVEPEVRVTVTGYRPFYTIGQVHRPGSYPYVIGLTVEKAIAIAGGLTNLASIRQLYLLREDAIPARRIKAGLDSLVLPGDTLVVEEGLF